MGTSQQVAVQHSKQLKGDYKKRGQPLAARRTQSPPRISLRPGIKPAEGLCKCLVELSSLRRHISPRPGCNDNRIIIDVPLLTISCGDRPAAFTNSSTRDLFFRPAMRAVPMNRASPPESNISRESEARCFAGDENSSVAETVAFSPLPHNPAFHPRRLFFATAAAERNFYRSDYRAPKMRRPCLAPCE